MTAYVTALSRWLVLAGALSASTELIASVIAAPAAFGLGTPPDLTSVYWLSTFQQLSTLYGDTAGRLVAFADPKVQTPPADPATQLAAATGWDQGQVSMLLAAYSSQTNRVLVLQALDRQFALLRKLGAKPAFVTQLISVTTNDSAAWSDYQALAWPPRCARSPRRGRSGSFARLRGSTSHSRAAGADWSSWGTMPSVAARAVRTRCVRFLSTSKLITTRAPWR